MKYSPPLAATWLGFNRIGERAAKHEHGVLLSLIAAVVVLAILALGVSSSALSPDTSCAHASSTQLCQAPGAAEIRP
jgi:hypothetical protein